MSEKTKDAIAEFIGDTMFFLLRGFGLWLVWGSLRVPFGMPVLSFGHCLMLILGYHFLTRRAWTADGGE